MSLILNRFPSVEYDRERLEISAAPITVMKVQLTHYNQVLIIMH